MRESSVLDFKSQNYGRTNKNSVQLVLTVFALFFVSQISFLVSSAEAATGINKTINFQGKLSKSDGTNVTNGTYSVVFTLYDASSGGTNLWTETQSVTTSNGIFQVALGSVNSLAGVNFNSDTIYLGIKVGTDSEMTPRIRFAAVPYALNADKLDGVVATQSATGFTLTGGSSTPKTLTLNDDITLGLTITPTSSNGLTILSNGANSLRLDSGSSGTMLIGDTNATTITFGKSGGGITLPGFATNNNSVLYTGGSGALGAATTTTAGLCLVSASNTPGWSNCPSNPTWNVNSANGILYSGNTTLDVLLGGVATSSAKFGFLNIAGGTPTASLSAGVTGGLSLSASGTITTTANQSLILGNSTSGHVILNPLARMYVGIGTVAPVATLDVRGATGLNGGTVPVATFSGTTSFASLVVNNSGVGDLLTASHGGVPTFTIQNNGAIVASNYQLNGGVFYTDATGKFIQVQGGANTILHGNGAGAPTFSAVNLNSADVTSTLGVGNGGTGQSSFNSGALLYGAGGSTALNSLAIGGANTCLISTGTVPSWGSCALGTNFWQSTANGTITPYNGTVDLLFGGVATSSATFHLYGSSAFAGTQAVASVGANTSFASLVVNNSGVGDLLTASHGGVPTFTIQNNGAIVASNYQLNGGVFYTDATGKFIQVQGGANTILHGNGAGAPTFSAVNLNSADVTGILGIANGGSPLEQTNNGAITERIITQDLLIGGISTSSAKFTVLNVAGGTPTASLSAGLAGGAYLTATGVLQTTANQTLTIGGTTTGNIIINPVAGNYLGVGTSNPLASLDLRATTGLNGGTRPVASVSGKTSFASMVVDNSGNGDLFTASSGGQTRFTVSQAGNVLLQGDMISFASNSAATTNNGTTSFVNALGDSGSIIPNSSFEASTSAGFGFADGWVRAASTSSSLIIDNGGGAAAAHGNNSARAVLGATGQAVFYSACVPISNQAYSLSMQVRPSVANPTVRAYIDGYSSKANCAANNLGSAGISAPLTITATNANAWNASGGVVTPPAGTQWGRVHILIGAGVATNTNIDAIRVTPNTITQGLDYAENYPADPSDVPQPGDVVGLETSGSVSRVAKASKTKIQSAIGIISTKPGELLDDGTVLDPKVAVALAGRVPVKVSTENGSILPGDFLTISSTPGVAMKATEAGYVIGQAMEGYTSNGIGTVVVFINKQFYAPDVTLASLDTFTLHPATQSASDSSESGALTPFYTLTDTANNTVSRIGTFAQAAVGNIQIGYGVAQSMTIDGYLNVKDNITAGILTVGDITTNSLTVTTENISIGGQTLRDYIASIVIDVMRKQQHNQQPDKSIAVSGLLTQQSGEKLFKQLLAENVLGASTSANFVSAPDASVLASSSATTRDDSLSLKSLDVDGLATISSSLRVKQNGLVEGIFTVVDTLMTKNLVVSGVATFLDDVVFKANVSFATPPTFSKDTAGFAIIKKDSDRVDVVFDKPYQKTPVVNVSISFDETPTPSSVPTGVSYPKDPNEVLSQKVLASGISYIVTKRTTQGFTILLNKSADEDISFSWTALIVDDPQTFESKPTILPTPTTPVSSPSPAGGNPNGEEVINNEGTH